MPQPNKGSAGTPHIAPPIIDKSKPAAKGAENVHYGFQPGGTHGSGK